MSKKRVKLGLALGSGSARGLVHIGILNVLHKNKIYPDYIAGTSMGAVMGAMYAAGYTPEEIKKIAKTTDLKNVIDFTFPKSGLLKGELVEKKLRKLTHNKKFNELNIPLRVVSYNLTKKQKVIFSRGNVAKAVRASSSIPGIFSPTIINNDKYIDGVVSDPTPYDVVREMGADVVIAVDLYNIEKKVIGPATQQGGLMKELKKKFIFDELLNVKNYLFPERWPSFIKKFLNWAFDKILYPARILKIIAGKELPEITKTLYDSIDILANNLAKERLSCANVDIKIIPSFGNLKWSDFHKVDRFVKIGEKAMENNLFELKKKLRS
tara:strand:- start:141 stop:1112 length:972 start_codon:yes stop_codon:yes gene_type:complete